MNLRLSFPEPTLEQRFLAEDTLASVAHLRAVAVVMFAIGTVCTLLSLAVAASVGDADRATWLRISVACGALMLSGPAAYALSRWPAFVAHYQPAVAVIMVSGMPGMTWPWLDAPADLRAHAYAFFMLHVFNIHALIRLRFVTASIAAAVVTAWYLAVGSTLLEQPRGAFAMQVLLLAAVNAYGMFTSYRFEAAARAEFLRKIDVERERDRSDQLLRNVLPAAIAERLKAGESGIADGLSSCTVLFADLVGFTSWSASVPPREVVAHLDDLFSAFDELSAKHGLEKIKTIGDAYMVAAGLPEERSDHAAAAAAMALDMAAVIAKRPPLQLRIGIHSGPVVAGVIGRRKFAYDLWGDTVNTASRMESHGEAGSIHISDATRALLADAFRCESRGTIEVKGKGPMTTWWLRGVAAA